MKNRGYTLIELIVAVGLFALIMTLSSGAYLLMIDLNLKAQGIATGINNLSFALETMTRAIRTGSAYSCGLLGGDCPNGGNSFSFEDANGVTVSYSLTENSIQETIDGVQKTITDPSVTVSAITFYVSGTGKPPDDYQQSQVTMVVSGSVPYTKGGTQAFTIETGATMRGSDI